jgi:hypothetical protein
LTKDLSKLKPSNDRELALLGFLLGAIYSLREATLLSEDGYSDEHLLPEYADILYEVMDSLITDGKPVNSRWLAGYHFNSGLNRISALNNRISKYVIGRLQDFTPDARNEVNRLKHDVQGVIKGRNVGMEDAIEAVEKLLNSLSTFMLR